MNSRERILAAIRHQPVDRLPTDIWATQEVWQKLYAHFQVDTRLAVYDRLGIDGIVSVLPPYVGPEPHKKEGYWENEWGMGYRLADLSLWCA